MSEDHGHSDCQCSQNIDFFEQILNGKNPLEDWLKKEIEKLLPNDLKYFVKLFDIIYDDNSKQSEINIVAPDKLERNHTVGNDMIINTKTMNDNIITGSCKNAIIDYSAKEDHNMNVKAGKTMTYNYACADYNSNLTIGKKKYVMQPVKIDEEGGKTIFVYVLDGDDNNDNDNDDDNDNDNDNGGDNNNKKVAFFSDPSKAYTYFLGAVHSYNAQANVLKKEASKKSPLQAAFSRFTITPFFFPPTNVYNLAADYAICSSAASIAKYASDNAKAANTSLIAVIKNTAFTVLQSYLVQSASDAGYAAADAALACYAAVTNAVIDTRGRAVAINAAFIAAVNATLAANSVTTTFSNNSLDRPKKPKNLSIYPIDPISIPKPNVTNNPLAFYKAAAATAANNNVASVTEAANAAATALKNSINLTGFNNSYLIQCAKDDMNAAYAIGLQVYCNPIGKDATTNATNAFQAAQDCYNALISAYVQGLTKPIQFRNLTSQGLSDGQNAGWTQGFDDGQTIAAGNTITDAGSGSYPVPTLEIITDDATFAANTAATNDDYSSTSIEYLEYVTAFKIGFIGAYLSGYVYYTSVYILNN